MSRLVPALRASLYNKRWPDRPGLAINKAGTLVGGTWLIGACYKNPNPLYGAYPRGYLGRVHTMFPDAEVILHAFSGGLTIHRAMSAVHEALECDMTGFEFELVDVMGKAEGRYPTWQGSLLDMPEEWAGRFDLVLADPPYSKEDAAKYGTTMPLRREVMRALRRVTRPGGNLVWLDTQWPQHRKDEWKTWAQIGLVRSTGHRMRLVSMFQAV